MFLEVGVLEMDPHIFLKWLLVAAVLLCALALYNWTRAFFAKCPTCERRLDRRSKYCPTCTLEHRVLKREAPKATTQLATVIPETRLKRARANMRYHPQTYTITDLVA